MTFKKVQLGSVSQVLNGYAFKSNEYVDDGIRVIRITNVQKGQIQDDDPKFIAIHRSNEFSRFMLEDGDILISLTGNVGRVGMISKSMLPAALNQRVGALKIESKSVDPHYIFHILNSDEFEQASIKNSKGVAQLNLSSKWIEKYEIPLPPLDEQKRIAAILDAADALRAKRRQSIAQLDALIQSTFLDLFGDPKANPKKWPKQKLGDLFKIEWGNTSITKESYVAKGVPAYSAAGCDGFLTEGEHEGEGIVLSAIGARCGKCFYVSNGLWTAIKNTITITPNQKSLVNFKYVFPMLNDEGFWPNRGAGQPFITLGVARVQEVPIPPLPLQQKFAAIVESVERQKTTQRAHLAELDALFAALQHRAFRGEL